tara:strand:- start:29 stop:727 length:699 start_codon:yes stop_codon:yes gene_type:complete
MGRDIMSLIEIGKKYPSSKNISGFIDLYQKYFTPLKDKKINILEIGVDNGDSLRIWREYFTNANICGIDIVKKNFIIENVDIRQGDQSNHTFLLSLINDYKKFDIIIDDGSHQAKHIIASFNYLFPYLSDNGLYIIEDLQTSYIPRYGGSRINLSKKKSSMNFVKSLTDSINYEKNNRPFFKKKEFDGLIKSIHFHQNIVFIYKGKSINYFYNQDFIETFTDKLKKFFSKFF